VVRIERVVLVVLDSVGVGAMDDAAAFGDAGTNTLANTARVVGGLDLPNLRRLGLGNVTEVAGVAPVENPAAAWGRCALASPNKDTLAGHWEMMGAVLRRPLPVFPQGFPRDLIEAVERATGVRGFLGNRPASGTEIIAELGDEHVRTGAPIVYTSADSVFQVAAHEDRFGLERLYDYCARARGVLAGDWEVARVIARPFVGTAGSYKRTPNRKDYALDPPGPTVLVRLVEAGIPVHGVGKIREIFNGKGVPTCEKTTSNDDGVEKILAALADRPRGLIFANLVDFDMLYGHRRDPRGYARSLEAFDEALPRILGRLGERDLLVLTSDHGNDPTHAGTDHTREYGLLLAHAPAVHAARAGRRLGDRASLADIGATIAEVFGVAAADLPAGRSFLAEL
jgi:phosphopentomutase